MKFLNYDKHTFNSWVFGVAFGLISVLTFVSFFYAWAHDEGTLGNNPLDLFLAESFNIWRFPTHNLLFLIIDEIPIVGILYFPLLLVNSIVYSFLIERFIVIFRAKTKNR